MSHILSTALVGLLLLADAVFCFEYRFYAYPIGLKTNPATGTPLDPKERIHIPDEPFWRVCVPEVTRPEEVRFNTELKKWLRPQHIRLVHGKEKSCGSGYSHMRLEPSRSGVNHRLTLEEMERLKRHVFEPRRLQEMIDKCVQRERELGGVKDCNAFFYSWTLAYADSDRNWLDRWGVGDDGMEDVKLGFKHGPVCGTCGLGYARGCGGCKGRSFEKVEWLVDEYSRARKSDHILYFNSDFQMGRAQEIEEEREGNGGYGMVDWYLDTNKTPHHHLVACGSNKNNYRDLMVWRNNVKMGAHCFPIMLTTSANQLQHIRDLWDWQQATWKRYRIPFDAKPMYLSDYAVTARGVGRRPHIYKKDSPDEIIRNFPPGRRGPLKQQYRVLDMDEGMSPAIRIWRVPAQIDDWSDGDDDQEDGYHGRSDGDSDDEYDLGGLRAQRMEAEPISPNADREMREEEGSEEREDQEEPYEAEDGGSSSEDDEKIEENDVEGRNRGRVNERPEFLVRGQPVREDDENIQETHNAQSYFLPGSQEKEEEIYDIESSKPEQTNENTDQNTARSGLTQNWDQFLSSFRQPQSNHHDHQDGLNWDHVDSMFGEGNHDDRRNRDDDFDDNLFNDNNDFDAYDFSRARTPERNVDTQRQALDNNGVEDFNFGEEFSHAPVRNWNEYRDGMQVHQPAHTEEQFPVPKNRPPRPGTKAWYRKRFPNFGSWAKEATEPPGQAPVQIEDVVAKDEGSEEDYEETVGADGKRRNINTGEKEEDEPVTGKKLKKYGAEEPQRE